MLLFRVRIVVNETQREGVLRSLMQTVWETSSNPGCLSARLCVNAGERGEMLLLEEWQSLEHLETRLRSDSLKVVLAAIDCSMDPPDVCIDTVKESRGFEFIAACRSGQTLM